MSGTRSIILVWALVLAGATHFTDVCCGAEPGGEKLDGIWAVQAGRFNGVDFTGVVESDVYVFSDTRLVVFSGSADSKGRVYRTSRY